MLLRRGGHPPADRRGHRGPAPAVLGWRATMDDAKRFLVRTDHGDVVLTVNPGPSGLDPDLLSFEMASGADGEPEMATPLRAFAAKMVDLIEAQGVGAFAGGPRMREMLVREKATADLRRIERFAREHGRGSG